MPNLTFGWFCCHVERGTIKNGNGSYTILLNNLIGANKTTLECKSR